MYGNCGSVLGLGMGYGPWLLLILVLVTLTILFSRDRNIRPEKVDKRGDEALELLRHRYAAGELSEENFQVMKNRLQE